VKRKGGAGRPENKGNIYRLLVNRIAKEAKMPLVHRKTKAAIPRGGMERNYKGCWSIGN